MLKAIVTTPIGKNLLNRIKENYEDIQVEYQEEITKNSDKTLNETEIVITYGYDINERILNKMPNLKWIHIMQAGIEHLPFDALKKSNILITNVKGIHKIPMAEYTMSMMLQIVRRSNILYEAQKRKEWDLDTHFEELYGKTLGILGLGTIGTEIAKRAKCFGMRVLGLKRNIHSNYDFVDEILTPNEKETIFKECDFIVNLLPVTPETKDFINSSELEMMKPNAYLINIGRGEVINEKALIDALEKKLIGGVILDVFSIEPLPKNHRFWEMENVTITPHISGDRFDLYMHRSVEILEFNLKKFPNKKNMNNVIDIKRGY